MKAVAEKEDVLWVGQEMWIDVTRIAIDKKVGGDPPYTMYNRNLTNQPSPRFNTPAACNS